MREMRPNKAMSAGAIEMNNIILTDEQMEMLNEEGVIVVLKCPQCKKITVRLLSFADYYNKSECEQGSHLHVCSATSCGVYRVYLECPNCQEEVDL